MLSFILGFSNTDALECSFSWPQTQSISIADLGDQKYEAKHTLHITLSLLIIIWTLLSKYFTWRNAIPMPTAPRMYNWLRMNSSNFIMQPPWEQEKGDNIKILQFIQLQPIGQLHIPPPCRCWRDGLSCHNEEWWIYSSCQAPPYLLPDLMQCTDSSSSHRSCCCHSTWTRVAESGKDSSGSTYFLISIVYVLILALWEASLTWLEQRMQRWI